MATFDDVISTHKRPMNFFNSEIIEANGVFVALLGCNVWAGNCSTARRKRVVALQPVSMRGHECCQACGRAAFWTKTDTVLRAA